MSEGGGSMSCLRIRTRGGICQARAPHLLPSFHSACSIPGVTGFNSLSLQQDSGTQWRWSKSPSPLGVHSNSPSWWEVPLQILVDNAFPGVMGCCFQQHNILIHSEGQWLFPMTSTLHSRYWVSQQGSPDPHIEQRCYPSGREARKKWYLKVSLCIKKAPSSPFAFSLETCNQNLQWLQI